MHYTDVLSFCDHLWVKFVGQHVYQSDSNFLLVSDLCDRQVTYPDHEVLTETLNIPHGPDHYSALKHDFLLRRIATTTSRQPSKLTQANPTPHCNHTVHLEGGGAITRSTWTGLGVGLGLVAALRSLIDWSCSCRVWQSTMWSTRAFWDVLKAEVWVNHSLAALFLLGSYNLRAKG